VTLALVATTSVAHASDTDLYDRLWPEPPISARLSLSQQLIEQLTVFGNTVGFHMNQLSADVISFEMDARARTARFRVGGGDARYLTFELAGDIEFVAGEARITPELVVGIAGRTLRVELPEVDMVPASYRGERGVEIRIPIFRRTF
jgi:hypothetical protein